MVKIKRDMTSGPIFINLILFALPIMLTGLLQVAYNMADNIVVGSFSGDETALAAIGCTSSLTTLIVNLLMGIAMGSGVVVSHAFGANDKAMVSRSVHTCIAFSAIIGVIFSAIAFALSGPALTLMQTKPELFDSAKLYFRIIALGVPATTVYNFGASILRSIGDSKTPLYILGFSGLLNVSLNLFFVLVCKLSIGGVAIATIISQYLSAAAIIIILVKNKREAWGLSLKKLYIDKIILIKMIRFGLPAGLQSALFSITNILLTTAANQLSTISLSAKTISFNIDALVYTAMDSYLHTSMTFVGQNYGAKNYDRIKKGTLYSIIQVAALGLLLGQIIILFGENIIGLYIEDGDPNRAAVTEEAMNLTKFILSLYFLAGIMNTISGALRGLGNSFVPMLIGIIGTVVVRVVWVFVFFPMKQFHWLNGLYYCYPITWCVSIIALIITFIISLRRAKERIAKALEKERVAAAQQQI